jgi:hypothetical protein
MFFYLKVREKTDLNLGCFLFRVDFGFSGGFFGFFEVINRFIMVATEFIGVLGKKKIG